MKDVSDVHKYYVYTLAYPSGQVFYVGKGSRFANGQDRIDQHERLARKPHRSWESGTCEIIRQIWACGGEVKKAKVYEGLTEEESFAREKALIKQYGLQQLVNSNPRKPDTMLAPEQSIQVSLYLAGSLRDQVRDCMLLDNVEYTRVNVFEYVQDICYQALRDHAIQKLGE